MRRPDEQRGAGPVADRLANLGHEVREVGLGDKRLRPQTFLQHRFGQDFRAIQYERDEQVERLGREVNLAAALRQLPGVEIEGERAEADAHAEAWAKPAKSLDIP